MKKAITKRLKITKNKKIKRRALALGHCRSNKRKIQILRKKSLRGLKIKMKKVKNLSH